MPADWLGAPFAIAAIELAGALLIVAYCASAAVEFLRTRDPGGPGRLLIIEGALWGLNLKTAGSLLKTIELQTWAQIGAFAAILTLRTVIKRVMMWEQGRIAGASGG